MNHLSVFILFSIIFGACLGDGVKTKWDLQNICFTKAENQAFNFTISSMNNSMKYSATTYRESDDPKVQRVKVDDRGSDGGGIYEINFTDVELRSEEIFCRGYDKIIDLYGSVMIGQGKWINADIIRSLV